MNILTFERKNHVKKENKSYLKRTPQTKRTDYIYKHSDITNSSKQGSLYKITQKNLNGFRLNFRNSLHITQKTRGQILVKNRKKFQIFQIPEYLEQEKTLLYLNKNCT